MIKGRENMRRLTIVTDTYSPMKDGVLTYLRSIIPLLKEHYDITIIAPKLPNRQEGLFDGVETVLTPNIPIELASYRPALPSLGLARAIRKTDVVMVNDLAPLGATAVRLAHYLKKPLLLFCHHDEKTLLVEAFKLRSRTLIPSTRLSNLVDRIVARHYDRADVVLVATQRFHEKLKRLKVPKEKIIFAPFAVDWKMFSPGNGKITRREYGMPDDAKVILYLGRMSHEKNVETIIRAMPRVLSENEDAWFVFAGGGPRVRNYNALAEKLGNERVTFIGEVEWEDVPQLLSMADIFVHPSLHEAQSFTVMEAMATALTVIVPAETGTSHTYLEENANCLFLRNPMDVEELVGKINFLIKDETVRRTLGKAARERVTAYSWENHLEKLLSGIELAISGVTRRGIHKSRRAKARKYAVA
ncbi:MAG: glycosyltransferase family 4 protein, partial [Candidatus Hydrothermarchaeota archaeon]|nr:glycosyltransferase family 4 protein [Candidatus Hydrothermarchaeota archaeon]